MEERQFGPYRLVDQVAVGGMAEIYLARTAGIAGFEKYVALKMIHPNYSEDQEFIQMLIDEAKITVQLQHVNIAQTFDLGRVGSTYYITMEYVEGADLYHLLRKGSEQDREVPFDVAAYVAKEVATGLDYAHRKRNLKGDKLGIVHRDVSPQNVLISFNGEVKIVDFGIAKATMRARQTAAGVIKGKYYYMSPEQAWGEPVDHRSDIFSNGILLYEMLTGQMLYLEEDLRRLLERVRSADIPPATTVRADIPPALHAICMKALAKDREDRYQTANEFATELERFLHDFSPVFRAPKVAAWSALVLADEEEEEIEETDPHLIRSRASLTEDKLVRERSEITDENSMIYRLSDILPGSGQSPRRFDEATAANLVPERSRERGGVPPVPRLRSRQPNDATQSVQRRVASRENAARPTASDTSLDDETVISGAPTFGGTETRAEYTRPTVEASAPSPVGVDSVDATVADRRARSNIRGGLADVAGSTERAREHPSQEEKTRDGRDRGDAATRAESKSARARKRVEGGERSNSVSSNVPSPAALSASVPSPAVSALHPRRKPRRTPAEGLPTKNSVLSRIIKRDGSGSVKGAPVVRGRAGNEGESGTTGNAPSATPGYDSSLTDGTTSRWAEKDAIAAARRARINTASRSEGVDVDEIPESFKLGREASRRRWQIFFGSLALIGCVGLGLAVGRLLFVPDARQPVAKSLEIVSVPRGATVTVGGRRVAGTTPLTVDNLVAGTTYQVEIAKNGFRPWAKAMEVSGQGASVVKVIARLEAAVVKLKVSSTPRGAEVFINGLSRGNTPLELDGLDPRSVETIELRLDGYRSIRQPLNWAEQSEQELHFELSK